MDQQHYIQTLTGVVEQLSEASSYTGLCHHHRQGQPLPSAEQLEAIVNLSRTILFPGYFGKSTVNSQTITYHIGVNVEHLYHLLVEQIQAGLAFNLSEEENDTESLCEQARQLAIQFISRLPEIRRTLATDVEAAYNGDPALLSICLKLVTLYLAV